MDSPDPETGILTLDDLLARDENKSATPSEPLSSCGDYQFPSQFSQPSTSISTSTEQNDQPDPAQNQAQPQPPRFISKIVRASEITLKTLATGDPWLDKFLNGGIAMTGITEISGEGGTGKTQFALQLCLHAQRAPIFGGLKSQTLYVSTEQLFPSKRLFELAELRNFEKDAANKIFVEHLADTESLLEYLETKVPGFLEKTRAKLLVIDTIAALFRADYTIKEMEARTKDLRKIGMALHELSRRFDIGIIVLNQVSGCLKTNSNIPSLGLVWSNMVTNRLVLSRVGYGSTRRTLTVHFSPYIPSGKIELNLGNSGFHTT